MRAILFCLAVLFLSEPMLAQQRRQPAPVPRTFVAKEPLPCVAFNSMAARLDAVYRIEDISQSEYDEGLKKYIAGTQADGVDYFASEKNKYQKMILQLDNTAKFIRCYAAPKAPSQ